MFVELLEMRYYPHRLFTPSYELHIVVYVTQPKILGENIHRRQITLEIYKQQQFSLLLLFQVTPPPPKLVENTLIDGD